MKYTSIVIIAVIISVLGLAGCGINTSSADDGKGKIDEQIVLGYCPTMKSIADDIATSDRRISLLMIDSSASAMQMLHSGNIDIALIGRLAKTSEARGADMRMLEEGYTVVGNERQFVQRHELGLFQVHTAAAREVAEMMLPNSDIIYHDTVDDAILAGMGAGQNSAVLIDWNDYRDSYELIIVMDGISKAREFRVPVLYSVKYDPDEFA